MVAGDAFRSGSSTASSSSTRAPPASIMRTPASTWPSSRPSLGEGDRDAAGERLGAADVVQERRGQQQVGVEPRVELGRLPAQRGHRHRVLEQAAGVGVVRLGRRARCACRSRSRGVVDEARDELAQALVVDLAGQELEESRPASRRRAASPARAPAGRPRRPSPGRAPRSAAGRRSWPPAQHAHRVALRRSGRRARSRRSTRRRPRGRCGRPARPKEGVAVARPPALLALHGEGRVDHASLAEIGHVGAPGHSGTSLLDSADEFDPPRARRSAAAGAPLRPGEGRARRTSWRLPTTSSPRPTASVLRARSDFSVVSLILPDSGPRAGDLLHDWRRGGALARDAEPAVWWHQQRFVGPDGVERDAQRVSRRVRLSPYEEGPHPAARADPLRGSRPTGWS